MRVVPISTLTVYLSRKLYDNRLAAVPDPGVLRVQHILDFKTKMFCTI